MFLVADLETSYRGMEKWSGQLTEKPTVVCNLSIQITQKNVQQSQKFNFTDIYRKLHKNNISTDGRKDGRTDEACTPVKNSIKFTIDNR